MESNNKVESDKNADINTSDLKVDGGSVSTKANPFGSISFSASTSQLKSTLQVGTETTYVKDPCDKQNSNPFLSPPLLPVSTTNPFAEAAFMEFFEAASAKGLVVGLLQKIP